MPPLARCRGRICRSGGAHKEVRYIHGHCPNAVSTTICQSAIFPGVITGDTFTVCATQRFMSDFAIKRQLLTGSLHNGQEPEIINF